MDWTPNREAGKPAERRETYRVLEDTHTLTGPRKSDPHLTVRRILVHSTANAAGRQAARDKRLAKAAEDLNKLTTAAGGRHYKTREKIVAKRRVTSCLRWTVTDNEDGTPALAWHFDTGVLKAEAAVDGWYALLTSVPADQADAGQALIHYKGQGAVERRYHDFKGPLAVAPVFVQHNRRVAALIQVICLALLVFCLIERQVRRALGPGQTMSGLYPDNRRVRPTGRHDLLPPRRTHPADRQRHRPAHRPDHPRCPTPPPRPPRHRHRTNPLATDLWLSVSGPNPPV